MNQVIAAHHILKFDCMKMSFSTIRMLLCRVTREVSTKRRYRTECGPRSCSSQQRLGAWRYPRLGLLLRPRRRKLCRKFVSSPHSHTGGVELSLLSARDHVTRSMQNGESPQEIAKSQRGVKVLRQDRHHHLWKQKKG